MNNEDMSEIIQKISNIMNNSSGSNQENAQDISSFSNDTCYSDEDITNVYENNNSDNNENNFNLDFETILKVKNIMNRFNSKKNSPETRLLMSLKPYLNNNRKKKLDQYMQFLNISKVIEEFNNFNGEVHKNDLTK